jgi:DNA-binding cell septation regulator SpoVG
LPAVAAHQASDEPGVDNQEHKDIAHPITQSFREYLQKRILDAYGQEKAKGPAGI